MTFDVIGFGALNLDKLYKVDMIAKEEEEAFVLDFKESPGGSAANTIVGLARLGLKTGYIGKIAEDREGKLLLDDFMEENVDTRGIVVSKKGRSGVVTGYVDEKGERALYVDPGVNDWLEFKEIDIGYASSSDFLHLTSFIGEKPFEAQKRLLREVSDARISFDPGAIYARKSYESLKPIIKRSFVMLPNEIESRLLTGKRYEEASKTLIKEGVNVVAVKLGERGCYVTDGRESQLVEPYEKELVDTTGAGDAFCAGFLYGLINGKDLYECGKLGNFVAARCISKMGARTGLPGIQELNARACVGPTEYL
ncbi:MAG: carbohydrate kinase family protein [Candidatus Bathyarchaeota archaeon]|nr:MAG: carbohydrate kinase family protein [Candidatus Bathyarchaeota archaeon]